MTCSRGHTFDTWTWLLVDLDEQPGVRSAPYALSGAICNSCNEHVASGMPLLLLNAHPDIPILSCRTSNGSAFTQKAIHEILGDPFPLPEGLAIESDRVAGSIVASLAPDRPAVELLTIIEDSGVGSIDSAMIARLKLDVANSLNLRPFVNAFYESYKLTSLNGLTDLLRRHPLASSPEFLNYIERHRASVTEVPDVMRKSLDLRVLLFRELIASKNPHRAWRKYRAETERLGAAVRSEQQNIEEVLAESADRQLQPGTARFDLYSRAILLAALWGDNIYVADLHNRRGLELIGGGGFLDDERSEAAIHDLQLARERSEGQRPEIYAEASSNLALVISRSGRGNPTENQEAAISLLDECLQFYTIEHYPDQWALCTTNLAILYHDRETGDRSKNLLKARALCNKALEVRAPEVNVVDWSFTAAELARILAEPKLADTRHDHRRNLQDALHLYRTIDAALESAGLEGRRSGILSNRASAALSLARTEGRLRKLAQADALLADGFSLAPDVDFDRSEVELEGLVDRAELATLNPMLFGSPEVPEWARAVCDGVPTAHQVDILRDAISDATKALSIGDYAQSSAAGFTYKILADASELLNEPIAKQISHLERALESSRNRPIDKVTHEILANLGAKTAKVDEWERSADYFRQAIDTIKISSLRRLESVIGTVDWSSYPKLVEWCSYALAKVGKYRESVLVLENARSRTLGTAIARDEADLQYLISTDDALTARFVNTRQRLKDTKVSMSDLERSNDSNIIAEFEQVVSEIRQIPKLRNFMGEVDFDQISDAARAFGPIAYATCTPAGTICLLVYPASKRGDDDAVITCVADTTVASSDIVRCIARFTSDGLGGIYASGADLAEAIDEAGVLLGEAFGNALSEKMKSLKCKKVGIVPGGILSLIPYSAIRLGENKLSSRRMANYFGDRLSVAIAPSSVVMLGSCKRVKRMSRQELRLVAVADPQREDPLKALRCAEPEVRALKRIYGSRENEILIGPAATVEAFMRAASGASHIHFAGHGRTDLNDPLRSAIECADGSLSAGTIRESAVLDCRLFVLSACQSGVLSFGEAVDLNDAIGLPSEILGAGSACVVASLWPVDDEATSLLMIKFHQELQKLEGKNYEIGAPAEALRRAQVWLRTRSRRQIRDYYLKHSAALNLNSSRLLSAIRGVPPKTGISSAKPFSHPVYWAPFVVLGA